MCLKEKNRGAGTMGQWRVCPFRWEGLAEEVLLKLELTMRRVEGKCVFGRKNTWQTGRNGAV